MEILKTKVIKGPNYWSIRRNKLIVITLDLENHQNILTSEISNFNQRLKFLMPSLYEHYCSEGKPGGFFERLIEGTLLGHVFEHICLELQTLSGMECNFGRARKTEHPSIYSIVYSYEIEEAGIYAGKCALNIINTFLAEKNYSNLENNINELKRIFEQSKLGPSAQAIMAEAILKDIPCLNVKNSLLVLGYGEKQKFISATIGHNTSCIGVDIVADKDLTKQLLDLHCIPTPKGTVINSATDLKKLITKVGYPLTIKPRFGNHGRGVITNIVTLEKAIQSYRKAKKISSELIGEKFIEGSDFRFLVINYKLVAVAKRIPPFIIGDGISTIKALIQNINKDFNRGIDHEKILTQIKIDEMTLSILHENNLTLETILPLHKLIYLKYTANMSTGATAVDVTDIVHPDSIFLAERISRIFNLDVCGIDIIAQDITKPISKDNGAILEINAAPGFRMHLYPSSGKKRDIVTPFLDMLFPQKNSSRIPIIAVTGTNGKTTVVRLISHIAHLAGFKVGMTNTEGIYINKKQIYKGDCSGPRSSTVVIRDPTVNFAVLECARGGILRSGLAFDKCSISIVTNISEDHIGQDGINTIEDLAHLKLVVPQSTAENGYSILNANDDYVYSFKNKVNCRIALFSLNYNDRIQNHILNKKLCAYIHDEKIYLSDNGNKIYISSINEIPITLQGALKCMQQNILPAILTAWINDIPLVTIIEALKSFVPSYKNLPGRMNLFSFRHCKVLLDYAHNEEAYKILGQFLITVNASKKIAIIAGTGDRRNLDIQKTGAYAAHHFDEIVIRHDKDSRGRTNLEITNLIMQGIQSVNIQIPVTVISDEFHAIKTTIANAPLGSFIWCFPDNIQNSIEYINQLSQSFSENQYET